MRRAPWVLAGTVAGLVGILSFRSSPQKITLSTLPTTSPAAAASTTASGGSSGGTVGPVAPTTSAASGGVVSATGPQVNYFYGVLSVRVTAASGHITKIAIASLSDGAYAYSHYVDSVSLPMLIKQAMAAQSAKIQGVSGASYTSAGFAQSLQGALSSLKLS
ncbi:MAG: FMN-binding protein [Acidimicrobiales bacterium]